MMLELEPEAGRVLSLLAEDLAAQLGRPVSPSEAAEVALRSMYADPAVDDYLAGWAAAARRYAPLPPVTSQHASRCAKVVDI